MTMKKKIVRRIVLITMIALIVLSSIIAVVINYTNYKATENNIEKIADTYEKMISKWSKDEILEKLGNSSVDIARITIFDDDKKIFVDNMNGLFGINDLYDDEEFDEIKDGKVKKKLKVDSKNNRLWLNYTFKMRHNDFENGTIIVNVGYIYENNMQRIYLSIPTLIIAFFVVSIFATLLTNKLIKTAVTPFEQIQDSLEEINRGSYHQVTLNTKYEDINKVMREINDVSAKISNSINYLNYEQKKSQFLLYNMRQGVLAISKKGKIILANNVIKDIFMYDKNILGYEISFISSNEILNNRIEEAFINGENDTFEVEIRDKVYRVDIQQIDDRWFEDFRGIALIVLFTDITEEFNSNRIRSEFFANASHELKTPLTAIKGYAELMTAVDSKEVCTKCIEEINKNAGKMLTLIQDMLKLSKLDAKIIDEEFTVVDLRQEVDDVVDNLMSLALDSNISITIQGSGKIWGMKKLIGEMITNIVGNAIKYNKENGSIDIKIATEKDSVVLSVSDTGIGIPQKDQGRIFERFYLPDKGRNKKVMSTGLGLAIVKHIVMQHNAAITVNSEEGVGSTFTVTFPRNDEEIKQFLEGDNE